MSDSSLQTEFVFICIFGLFVAFINAFAGGYLFVGPLSSSWKNERFLKGLKMPCFLRRVLYGLLMTSTIIVIVFMALVMVVSPFVSSEMRWKAAYRDTCKGMDIRVYLDSPESRPAVGVEFLSLSSGERFTMSMNPDPWHVSYNDRGVYNFSIISENGTDFVPAWGHISYNLDERKFEVWDTNSTITTEGDFSLGSNFLIQTLDMRGDLGAFTRRCVFDPTVQILDTAERNGKVVMKTAQFKICDLLQVCADGGLGDMAAVPIGLLILQRAGRRGTCCSGRHRVPGIEGRD